MNRRRLLGLVVTAALLVGLVALLGPARLAAAFRTARWDLVAAAALFIPPILWARQVRWLALARVDLPDVSGREAWRSYLGGLTLAVITPFSAGELVRGMLLDRGDQIRLASFTLVDKLIDLSWVLVLGFAGLIVADVGPVAVHFAGMGTVPVAWLLVFSLARSTSGRGLTGRVGRVVRATGDLPNTTFWVVVGSSGLGFLVYLAQAWVLLRAVAPGASFSAVALWPAVTVSTIVPAFLGGLGPREATAALLLPKVGVDASAAATAAFLQFLLLNVLPGVAGAFTLGDLIEKHRRRDPGRSR